MPQRLPAFAILLGLAGLLPFLGCAAAGLSLPEPQAGRWLVALLDYGAVILAFLGGVHWGFVLQPGPPAHAVRIRLGLGVTPSLIAWLALMAPLMLPREAGFGLLILGFVATVIVEARLTRVGLVPTGYMWLRWGLSVVVVAVLISVLVILLAGARLIF